MIIWRGRGVLVAIITFGCLLATELLTRFFYYDNTYYQRHGWPKLAVFLLAASLVWGLSRREGDDSADLQAVTSEPVLREQDTLFLISAKYWPRILCVLAFVFYFVRSRD
jgi:hypothetical protein